MIYFSHFHLLYSEKTYSFRRIFFVIENWSGKNARMKRYGFQRYLYKIISSTVLLVLIPICILGIFWFTMMTRQSEQKFHEQKSIELNEIVTALEQRIKTIKLEVATETREDKYSTYTHDMEEYSTNLSSVINRLSIMTEKYHLIDSVYFYDRTTNWIYNSKSGRYIFDSFYDTKWINDVDANIYSVQHLPLRYSFDRQDLLDKYGSLYREFNKLVLSIVIKGRPDYFLVSNISIDRLYNEIADIYTVHNAGQEFFFLNSDGELIEGNCNYTNPVLLFSEMSKTAKKGLSFHKQDGRVYYMKSLDSGIYCVSSYSVSDTHWESQYLGKYIVLVCLGLLFFLLIISIYISKRLYQPINTLYAEISESARNFGKDTHYDEIDMLRQVFMEMNIFNSNAKLKLIQSDEIRKMFNFRSFLENSRGKKEFIHDHPYLFDDDGKCCCEMLMIKFEVDCDVKSGDEEMLFYLNLQEVLRTYLQSSEKGILTKIEEDILVLLYRDNEGENIQQTRKVITDMVMKTTNRNTFFCVSQPIHSVDEIISQCQSCRDLVNTAYFFGWNNSVIAVGSLPPSEATDDLSNMLMNINASIIHCIVSQDESCIDSLLKQLEDELRKINNASLIKDLANRLLVELDQEFHFSNAIGTNLLQTMHKNGTLVEIMKYIEKLLKQISAQCGSNEAKENNYCELAKKYLSENYMNDMNITYTADYLDISYSYLSKIFRAKTGMTLTDYLNTIRIEKSKEYLKNTFMTLGEISEKVGYNNAQSYQRFFKKYVNITPGDYRKLHLNNHSHHRSLS